MRELQISNNSREKTSVKGLISLLLVAVVVAVGVHYYRVASEKNSNEDNRLNENSSDDLNREVSDEPEPKYTIYENTPPYEGAQFFELNQLFGGEMTYIAHPIKKIEGSKLPVVVYSHGSNTLITENMSDSFMVDMRQYGEYFTSKGYIFAASNQHGANWGSNQAVEDTLAMIEGIKATYEIEDKVFITGFSMGGLPSFNFTFKYPEMVSCVGLLAPTTRPESWSDTQIATLSEIPVKIWHGDADVNVGQWLTLQFIDLASRNGKEIQFVNLEGKGHFDLDTEYIAELEQYFSTCTDIN